jgi:hypothetical protein
MRYDARCWPGSTVQLDGRGNCQTFAYAVLRHFGRVIPDFRSRELWLDEKFTFEAAPYAALDIVLFGATHEAYGAHLGIHVGDERVLHLSKHVGIPAVWTLDELARNPRYRVRIGAKRTRQ